MLEYYCKPDQKDIRKYSALHEVRPAACIVIVPKLLAIGVAQASNAAAVLQDSPPQQGLTAAYQGNPGAYSEGAVLAAFPDGHPVPCEHFEDAFQALSQYLTDRAVLPIENSLGGSIHAVYDLLIQ